MKNLRTLRLSIWPACLLLLLQNITAAGPISDLNTWTLVEDPAHPNFSSSVDSPSQITLSASGAVPNATDIGYQSVDGATPGTSTSGQGLRSSC